MFSFFFYLPFLTKRNYSKVGGGKYYLEDENIMRCTVCLCLYITFTVLWHCALCSAHCSTQVRTKFIAPTGRASFFRWNTGFSPVHIPGRLLCGEWEKERKICWNWEAGEHVHFLKIVTHLPCFPNCMSHSWSCYIYTVLYVLITIICNN